MAPDNRTSLSRTVGRLSRQLERRLDAHGLTLAQFRALSLLADETVSAARVADWLAVSPPSVTSVVDGLVARGLAERRRDPSDRRRQAVAITRAGREVLVAAEHGGDALLEEIAATMAPGAGHLVDAIREWGEALDRWRAAGSPGSTGPRVPRPGPRSR
jgi:DNA-binding MarR family transcriptional regulator